MRRNRTILPLVVVLSASVYAGVGAGNASAATAAPSADPNTAVVHVSSQNADQVAAYWTPARMRAAKQVTSPKPTAANSSLAQSHVLPPRSGAGARSARTTPGATVAGPISAAAVSQSQVWTSHGSMPATTVGKLYFTDTTGAASECSAAVVTSGNHSMIWTAGHCVTDGSRHWYSNFSFVPDYHDGVAPLGSWVWKSVSSPTAYFDGGNLDFDLAAISLWPRSGVKVADWTGSQGYKFNYGYEWANTYAFGYPYDAHPARAGFNGQQLRYCIGTTWRPWGWLTNLEAMHCDMGHGSSGGPWLYDLQVGRGWGYLVGNVSHGPSMSSDETRSPHFGDAAVNVYNAQTNA